MTSPVPYLTDDQYAALPATERWLIAAAAYVGVHEVGAENHGPEVAQFLAAVKLPEGYPWCAAFATFTAGRAGIDIAAATGRSVRELAAVATWAQVAKDKEARTEVPRRGMAFYWVRPDGSGHIGLVTEALGTGEVLTIEGNTNRAGSREGDGVYRRSRSLSTLAMAAHYQKTRYGFMDLGKVLGQ